MVRSTSLAQRTLALVLVAWLTQGCATGHLLDAARRDERVERIDDAWTDGARLYVRYTARVTTERGDPVGRRDRTAALDLAALREAAGAPVDALPVQWVTLARVDGARRLAVRRTAATTPADGALLAFGASPPEANGNGHGYRRNGHHDVDGRGDGRVSGTGAADGVSVLPVVATGVPWLRVRRGGDTPATFALVDGRRPVAVPVAALERGTTAPWAWPLVPFTAIFDVATTPVMVFFALPLLSFGD